MTCVGLIASCLGLPFCSFFSCMRQDCGLATHLQCWLNAG